jgi:hypothetical protein
VATSLASWLRGADRAASYNIPSSVGPGCLPNLYTVQAWKESTPNYLKTEIMFYFWEGIVLM